MEGIDIVMVWNSLLNNLRCGLKCAGRLLFVVLVEDTWEFTAAATCRKFDGTQITARDIRSSAVRASEERKGNQLRKPFRSNLYSTSEETSS